jgi:hypothetical protein
MIEQRPMRAAGNAMAWKLVQMGGVKMIYMVRLFVLAILLVPADFGLVAIATSATGFLLGLTNVGLIPAVVQAKDMDDEKYDAAWTFDMSRSFVVATLTIIFAPVIANIFAEPMAVPIIQALALRPLLESTDEHQGRGIEPQFDVSSAGVPEDRGGAIQYNHIHRACQIRRGMGVGVRSHWGRTCDGDRFLCSSTLPPTAFVQLECG